MGDMTFTSVVGKASGDAYADAIDKALAEAQRKSPASNKINSDENQKEFKRLLSWFHYEREKQAQNRMEMATDVDFYDNKQWSDEDEADLASRGQAALNFNEVAPMIDWLIGTERRARADWKVLPRTEDDVDGADVKTKTLKYVSDVNRVQFARSMAFGDAMKAGIGFVDDGVTDDPTKDIIYSTYEDWRCVLWDSACPDLDLATGRYIFRWRYVDLDIAIPMFPDCEDVLRRSAINRATSIADTPEEELTGNTNVMSEGNYAYLSSEMAGSAERLQVKLIECQYRKPAEVTIVESGAFKGAFVNEADSTLHQAIRNSNSTMVKKTLMRVHVAVFTPTHLLSMSPSIYRHNQFSLTPIFAFRRGRDKQPYGPIRRVRDVQRDLNKRASKALHILNTNQIIMDKGSVEDINLMREEASDPNGVIEKKAGSEFLIRRDDGQAAGQIQMMAMDAQAIQKSAGVSQENLGRQTNAVSGEAIKARQMQGSVVTTELFDNLRMAIQCQGSKQLSLVEQFYTQEKVVRLTGAKGAIQWVKINQPEQQADGSIRYLNDMTSSMADFIVADQDYSGTLRHVMFDSMQQMASKLDPQMALKMMTIAMEYSDLPNKDEIAEQFRRMTGERDPNKPMSPEEAQQAEQQAAQQAEALQVQRTMAQNALAEGQAKVREINARAAQLEAQSQSLQSKGQATPETDAMFNKLRDDAANEIDRLSQALQKVQGEASNKLMQLKSDRDTAMGVARIEADGKARVAEITSASDKKIEALGSRLEDLAKTLEDIAKKSSEAQTVEAKEDKAEKTEVQAPAPITVNVTVDATKQDVSKTVTISRGKDGKATAHVVPLNEEPPKGSAE